MSTEPLTLYYAPKTRAFGALVLLEELGCPYRLHVLDMKAGEQRAAAYLAINPMGKVPALKHGDAVVTEQAAVYMYAADLYPAAKLAPEQKFLPSAQSTSARQSSSRSNVSNASRSWAIRARSK